MCVCVCVCFVRREFNSSNYIDQRQAAQFTKADVHQKKVVIVYFYVCLRTILPQDSADSYIE